MTEKFIFEENVLQNNLLFLYKTIPDNEYESQDKLFGKKIFQKNGNWLNVSIEDIPLVLNVMTKEKQKNCKQNTRECDLTECSGYKNDSSVYSSCVKAIETSGSKCKIIPPINGDLDMKCKMLDDFKQMLNTLIINLKKNNLSNITVKNIIDSINNLDKNVNEMTMDEKKIRQSIYETVLTLNKNINTDKYNNFYGSNDRNINIIKKIIDTVIYSMNNDIKRSINPSFGCPIQDCPKQNCNYNVYIVIIVILVILCLFLFTKK